MAKKVKVNLGKRSYDILIGPGTLKSLRREVLKLKKKQVVIITDVHVGGLYASHVKKSLKGLACHVITMPAGEKYKTLYAASAIYDKLIALKLNRDGLIIALGGGVIGDLAGFAAATYMRGVDIIQVPTSLLAMVDAAIGGKTAVDHKKGKNLIGVFHQPRLVIADVNVLNTLPPMEFKNGLAEVLKYGFIKDPQIVKMIASNPKVNSAFLEKIVSLCAKIKAEVVSKDERESTGYRMILNFGHTIGHAVEALGGYNRIKHGEAVGFGMAAASLIGLKLRMINKQNFEKILFLIARLKLPIQLNYKADAILKALQLDKKARSGKIRFVLPKKIGQVVVRDNVPDQVILSALKGLGCK